MNFRKNILDLYYEVLRKNIRILTYHSISEDPNPFAIKKDVFKRQIETIWRNDLRVISLAEAVRQISNADIQRNTVVLTFDDGYKDNFTNAVPVLKEFNFPACFFVVTGAVGKKNSWDQFHLELMGWDELSHLIAAGHIIGSHTHSHSNLSGVNDKDLLGAEIGESCWMIRDRLKTDFVPFSFPYGSGTYNEVVRREVVKTYNCAVKSGGSFANNRTTDLWSLKRVRIDRNIDLDKFKQIVKGHADINQLFLMIKNMALLSRDQ